MQTTGFVYLCIFGEITEEFNVLEQLMYFSRIPRFFKVLLSLPRPSPPAIKTTSSIPLFSKICGNPMRSLKLSAEPFWRYGQRCNWAQRMRSIKGRNIICSWETGPSWQVRLSTYIYISIKYRYMIFVSVYNSIYVSIAINIATPIQKSRQPWNDKKKPTLYHPRKNSSISWDPLYQMYVNNC